MFFSLCHPLHEVFFKGFHFLAHYMIPFLMGMQGSGERVQNFLTKHGGDIAIYLKEVKFPAERINLDLFFDPET